MADRKLRQVIAFCRQRYLEYRDYRPTLAAAYITIMNQAIDVELRTGSVTAITLFLSRPRKDPDLGTACNDVKAHMGVPPEA
jgi:hypothetical protein